MFPGNWPSPDMNMPLMLLGSVMRNCYVSCMPDRLPTKILKSKSLILERRTQIGLSC